ncbi:MAG: M48 family metallopeptidase [Burkholderiales bacterium]|nr:M48 family metallopeptidase [Burkholderiales bacterium]
MSIPHHPRIAPQHPAPATGDVRRRMMAARGTHLDTDQIGLIELDGQPVEYVMRRSLRRTRAMLSLSDRGLVLAVPMRMSARAIETFLQHSHPWLRRHFPRWRDNARPHLELTTLQRVLWQGASLPIDVGAAAAPSVRPEDGRIGVRVPDPADPGAVRAALRAWVQSAALPHFEERARHFAPMVGVDAPPIRLTNARTLWGSCTPAGLVRVNWRLMQGPAHLVDYVVVHELAHLVEANHSARFWAVVERGYREHREARRELTEWQRRLAAL